MPYERRRSALRHSGSRGWRAVSSRLQRAAMNLTSGKVMGFGVHESNRKVDALVQSTNAYRDFVVGDFVALETKETDDSGSDAEWHLGLGYLGPGTDSMHSVGVQAAGLQSTDLMSVDLSVDSTMSVSDVFECKLEPTVATPLWRPIAGSPVLTGSTALAVNHVDAMTDAIVDTDDNGINVARDNKLIPLSKDNSAKRGMEPTIGVMPNVKSPGEHLIEVRKDQDLSLDDVADELNLSRDVIAALEEDRQNDLPGATYARGYVRTYARFLKIDDDTIESWFESTDLSVVEIPSRISNTATTVSQGRGVSGFGSIMVLITAITIGATAWLGYKQNWFSLAVAKTTHSSSETVKLGPAGDRRTGVQDQGIEGDAVGSLQSGDSPISDQGVTVDLQTADSSTRSEVVSSTEQGTEQNLLMELIPKHLQGQLQGDQQPETIESNTTEWTEQPAVTELQPSQPVVQVTEDTSIDGSTQAIVASDAPRIRPNDTQEIDFGTTIQSASTDQVVVGSTITAASGGDYNSQVVLTSDADDQYRLVVAGPTNIESAMVRLRGKSDSWVEVSDATGNKIFLDMVHIHESYEVIGRPPFRLLIGNAPGVEVEYEGYWIDVMANSNENNVARLILGSSDG